MLFKPNTYPTFGVIKGKRQLETQCKARNSNHPRKVIQWLGKAFDGTVQTAHNSTNKKENKNNGKS